ncbi:MAG: ATP-binding protein [Verrucomicrobia bacterium]|nr:ATP-binding protein [Verrucomicrobiota bacterium]
MSTELYANTPAVGLLKGFSPLPHQLEVDVVVPHQERGLPGFGEFLLVELSASEALVGRVSRYHAAGQLATDRGDAYLVDLAKTEDAVPAPLMRQMLRYNLKMQLLGHLQLQAQDDKFKFSVGERAFATLGSKVRVPSDTALAFLCNVGLEDDPTATPLGHLVYGQRELKSVPVRFSVERLKGRRSFVFARAGYGKSNLIKYLMSQLYSSPPDVGLLIFDPEGEYALPDAHGRPGLVNVPALRDRISLYTNRTVEPQHADVFRGNVYVDFGDFPPQDIVAGFVAHEKQDSVFANLLRSQDWDRWRELVALLAKDGFATEDRKIAELLQYRAQQSRQQQTDVSLSAIKNNLVPPIKRLHRPGATLGKNLLEELKQKRVVIADVSLLGSEDGLAITGMLLRRIFQNNVRHLTDRKTGQTVRCLAVLEEAQTMLGDRTLDDRNVFVRWVKEGRKYGLGCVLVTQQPSSISDQIISQGDNFFVLHLLNENDLQTLKRHNAYFSDEILGFIRGEPIPGNCYFWSAPSQPFVLPARVFNFESVCQRPAKTAQPVRTAASDPKVSNERIAKAVKEALLSHPRVWLFPVSTLHGKKEAGLVAFSREYLQEAVAEQVCEDPAFGQTPADGQWLQSQLPLEIETVLKRHKVRTGFAVLSGVSRPVWVLPQIEIKLAKGKSVRKPAVEVVERI